MSRANENPLFPASLAANGIQGADAKASGRCKVEHSRSQRDTRLLAVLALDSARHWLTRYAEQTDAPIGDWVEAADLLDIARDLMTQGGAP